MAKKDKEKPKFVHASEPYSSYINKVQKDFDNQITKYEDKLRRYACVKVILTVLVPIVLVINFYSTIIAICLTSAVSYCEFYMKLMKYEEKIKNLNFASCKLTCEYSLYRHLAGDYSGKEDHVARKMYIEKTSKLIMEADMATYKSLDLKAMDEAISKTSTK